MVKKHKIDKKRMARVAVVCILMAVLYAICVKARLEEEERMLAASRIVGGECDITYDLKGTVVEKRKNGVLLIAIEELYKERSPFEEDEIFVDCSGMHAWAYEKVAEGQIVGFSFRKDAAQEEIVSLLDIYPADARYAEKYYFQDDSAMDYDDLDAMQDDADYVFVGKVLGGSLTVYGGDVTVKDEKGESLEVAKPYTDYNVAVIQNIKGNLTTQEPVRMEKQGGLTKNGMACCLFPGDMYPTEGEEYVFYVRQQEEGRLMIMYQTPPL